QADGVQSRQTLFVRYCPWQYRTKRTAAPHRNSPKFFGISAGNPCETIRNRSSRKRFQNLKEEEEA
ncbi:hypothetical protein, partial [Ruminococcus callidus]|uniref:hypothetical protein n=1 Tax=Ruminococcus callidus TaxID=40519 RepID=UPI003993C08F